MKILGLRWDSRPDPNGSMSFASELAVADDAQVRHYILVVLLNNREGITVTRASLFDGASAEPEESYENEIDSGFSDAVFAGSRFYTEIRFARFALEQYLQFETEPEQDAADRFIAGYLGTDAEDQEVPEALYGYGEIAVDGYEGFDDDYSFLIARLDKMNAEEIMRRRLAAEAAEEDDPNGIDDGMREYLTALAAHCESEDGYRAWKEEYVRAALEDLRGRDFILAVYRFEGCGELRTVLPAEELDSLRAAEESGSIRMLSEPRPAAEEELRRYVCLHADDDCDAEEE